MASAQEKLYTINDINALPEGTRAELIDGQIYYMTPSTRAHQQLLLSISRQIADYIDRKGGPCEIYIAPFAVYLDKSTHTYVELDISVICDKNKLDDKGCNGSPDWIIEIVSPSSRRMDYSVKLFKYRSSGVREYWIVDPEKQRVMVHDLENEDIDEYSFSNIISAKIYDDLSIYFSHFRI